MIIGKYSFGTGDRFGMQGEAQLSAIIKANENGIPITPVWNKSYREHQTIKTTPPEVRKEADEAVQKLGWSKDYFVDADHINMKNVDEFIDVSDFFTIDVADYIGKQADENEIQAFVDNNKKYVGAFQVPGLQESHEITEDKIREIAVKFLFAVKEASTIYNHIKEKKGEDNFITEVSMDEVDDPQTPVELFFILSGLAMENIPVQTIAPKFSGRFNKGVDYEGNIDVFAKEFEEDLLILDKAIKEFNLPENLKLSVHSGSDKFSIYPVMGELITKHDKGIHVKTAGTTWLEELIGLALADGEALDFAKSIYQKAYDRREELCAPYASVIDIDDTKLPDPDKIKAWTRMQFANALRHIPGHPEYNPDFRQLIHVGYKVAAEYGDFYTNFLKIHKDIVGEQVQENIYDRHLKRLFNL